MVVIGCRKENPRDLGSSFLITEYPATCYNYSLDPGETSTDCGGVCPPCQTNSTAPPCSHTQNAATVTSNGATNSYSFSISSFDSPSGILIFRGTSGNRVLEIQLPEVPITSGIYYTNGSILSGNNSAVVSYRQVISGTAVYTYAPSNQSVYVTRIGNQRIATICSMQLEGTYNGVPQSQTITGVLTYN